jgi:hypothetical protein
LRHKLLVGSLICAIVWIFACANRYKHWALEQTYGQVPCVSLGLADVFDDTDVPALGEAPVQSWIVTCRDKAYLCSYREESAGWVQRMHWGPATVDEERRCIEIDDPPGPVRTHLEAESKPARQ